MEIEGGYVEGEDEEYDEEGECWLVGGLVCSWLTGVPAVLLLDPQPPLHARAPYSCFDKGTLACVGVICCRG